jgi:hypothetical protein
MRLYLGTTAGLIDDTTKKSDREQAEKCPVPALFLKGRRRGVRLKALPGWKDRFGQANHPHMVKL